MPNSENRSSPKNQKAMRRKIDELIQEKLNGDVLTDFVAFLDFLKHEKITCPWTRFGWEGIHTFHLKHKGQNVGAISILDGENHIRISVGTNGWRVENFDLYLQDQPGDVVDMLMERASYKCTKCSPNMWCFEAEGFTAEIAGKRYEKRCVSMSGYWFIGNSMKELTLYSPRAAQEPIGLIPLEMIKKLILAKKEHIIKCKNLL